MWAREVLIPRDLSDAVRALTTPRRVRVDVGRVRVASGAERRFLLMCNVGMDAEIVRRVEQIPAVGKRSFGRGWYAGIGAYVFGRSEPAGATVSVDGTVLDGPLLMAVTGNTRLYGGMTRLTAAARADDGVLDLCTFAGDGIDYRQGEGRGSRSRRSGRCLCRRTANISAPHESRCGWSRGRSRL